MALVSGCLSPTLPLPPPAAPDFIDQNVDESLWSLRGSCTPGAVVLIKNLATGQISGIEDIDADGRYFIAIEAEECDVAQLWEIVGSESSKAASFVITDTTPSEGTGSNCASGN
jgi:hypothetical protein